MDLTIRIFNEGVLYKNEIEQEMKNGKVSRILTFTNSVIQKLLLIIPQRLGMKYIDDSYYPQIKEILSCDISVGLLGGKRTNALYFLGYQNDTAITLDPHYT